MQLHTTVRAISWRVERPRPIRADGLVIRLFALHEMALTVVWSCIKHQWAVYCIEYGILNTCACLQMTMGIKESIVVGTFAWQEALPSETFCISSFVYYVARFGVGEEAHQNNHSIWSVDCGGNWRWKATPQAASPAFFSIGFLRMRSYDGTFWKNRFILNAGNLWHAWGRWM